MCDKIKVMADKITNKKDIEAKLKELDRLAHEGHKTIEEGRKMQNRAAREAQQLREQLQGIDKAKADNGTK